MRELFYFRVRVNVYCFSFLFLCVFLAYLLLALSLCEVPLHPLPLPSPLSPFFSFGRVSWVSVVVVGLLMPGSDRWFRGLGSYISSSCMPAYVCVCACAGVRVYIKCPMLPGLNYVKS